MRHAIYSRNLNSSIREQRNCCLNLYHRMITEWRRVQWYSNGIAHFLFNSKSTTWNQQTNRSEEKKKKNTNTDILKVVWNGYLFGSTIRSHAVLLASLLSIQRNTFAHTHKHTHTQKHTKTYRHDILVVIRLKY